MIYFCSLGQNNDKLETFLSSALIQTEAGHAWFEGNTVLNTVALGSLATVETYLKFYHNAHLSSVSFPELRSLGTNLEIIGNSPSTSDGLLSISMEKLETVGAHVKFEDNALLAQISLPRLKTVGGLVAIISNAKLAALQLHSLVNIMDYCSVASNPKLESILLPSLKTVGRDLSFKSNSLLEVISLPRLQLAGGSLTIESHSNLNNFTANSLFEVDGIFDVDGCTSLVALSAANLVTIDSLIVEKNSALEELSLRRLEQVRDFVLIRENSALTTISFPSLRFVQGDFNIGDLQTSLEVLSAPSLQSIGRSLKVMAGEKLGLVQVDLHSLHHILGLVESEPDFFQLSSSSANARVMACHGLLRFGIRASSFPNGYSRLARPPPLF